MDRLRKRARQQGGDLIVVDVGESREVAGGSSPPRAERRDPRERDRGFQARETLLLIGPDIGAEAQHVIGIAHVERILITRHARSDYRAHIEVCGRGPAPISVDERPALLTPRPKRRLIAETIPRLIEASARADFQEMQWTVARQGQKGW